MLRQYLAAKEKVPDCLLFFHMGDFYEMFFDDAVTASKVLSIALTSRDKKKKDPIPMCGVPLKAADVYLAKLVEAGFKVAICDQIEDPKKTKGLVKRDITRVVSPGMITDPNHLPRKDNLFLAAVCLVKDRVGLSVLDLASGEFKATEMPKGPPLRDELARLEPRELVLSAEQDDHRLAELLGPVAIGLPRTLGDGAPPSPARARDILGEKLPFDIQDAGPAALAAAAMAWQTVLDTQPRAPSHLDELSLYRVETHLVLDHDAQRNLELFRSIAAGGRKGSLIHAVDRTVTPMGARLLREWLGFPLADKEKIEARHQAVAELSGSPLNLDGVRELLSDLPDVPRLVGRAGMNQAGPRDLAGLRDALFALPRLEQELAAMTSPLLMGHASKLDGLDELAALLSRTLVEEPPVNLAEGGVIAKGVSPELDEQRSLSLDGKGWIAGLQESLRRRTGIPSLKVGFNKVFGYYLEVTKTHLDKVPEEFIRKQTLASAERYFTPELKEQEAKVLGAEEKAQDLERRLFEELRQKVAEQSAPLMAMARALAGLDALCGLARLALDHDYVRPGLNLDGRLSISAGRHPVVEQMLPAGEFVPNDLALDDSSQQLLIITGPNMAGKSTILRQAALICLLAQAGSFVPAEAADLPVVDRIFTRVGAMDDLAGGRSTFMVEMSETSRILKQATPRSLVILDEVGRGTSTYDGLSLAWAVAEHLHDYQGRGVKTLFATHYHELTELSARLPRARNFNVAVKEYQGGIVFLRRLSPGGVSRSYGLQVARLAGLPEEVLVRARGILDKLESGEGLKEADGQIGREPGACGQLALFSPAEHPVVEKLKSLDPDILTPLEALNLLHEMKREIG